MNYKIITQEDIVEMHLRKVSLFNTYIVIYYPAESMMSLDDINVAFGYKIKNENLTDGQLVIIEGEDSDLLRQRINQLVKKFQTVAIEIWSDGQKKYTGTRR